MFLERHVSTQNSALDSTFGINGVVELSSSTFAMYPTKVVVQQDQKMVVGGRANGKVVLVRLNDNGSLDNSFGTAGYSYFSYFSTNSSGFFRMTIGKTTPNCF
jgi:hypothetical protein